MNVITITKIRQNVAIYKQPQVQKYTQKNMASCRSPGFLSFGSVTRYT
jgi:hypothetical protein